MGTSTRSALGLSTAHICTPAASLVVAAGGSLVTVAPFDRRQSPTPAGGRGKITEFTAASRRRLLRAHASIDYRQVPGRPIFVTLTYPAGDWRDGRLLKRHWHAFKEWLRRRRPSAWGFWRVETQKRGALHLHLLLYDCPPIPTWALSAAWYRIVGTGDERHLAAGTRVEYCRSARQAAGYCAKYVAKRVAETPDITDAGRWWGYIAKKRLVSAILHAQLTAGEARIVRRRLRKLLASRGYHVVGTSIDRPLTGLVDWRTSIRLLEQLPA